MSAAKHNLTIEQGTTFRHGFQQLDGPVSKDPKAPLPPPVNLSGYTARMQLRTSIDAPDVLLELTTENTRITIDALQGLITLAIAAPDTAAMTFTSAVYDLDIISPSGQVSRIVQGSVSLSRSVTR